jgi:hypothetical protein
MKFACFVWNLSSLQILRLIMNCFPISLCHKDCLGETCRRVNEHFCCLATRRSVCHGLFAAILMPSPISLSTHEALILIENICKACLLIELETSRKKTDNTADFGFVEKLSYDFL